MAHDVQGDLEYGSRLGREKREESVMPSLSDQVNTVGRTPVQRRLEDDTDWGQERWHRWSDDVNQLVPQKTEDPMEL